MEEEVDEKTDYASSFYFNRVKLVRTSSSLNPLCVFCSGGQIFVIGNHGAIINRRKNYGLRDWLIQAFALKTEEDMPINSFFSGVLVDKIGGEEFCVLPSFNTEAVSYSFKTDEKGNADGIKYYSNGDICMQPINKSGYLAPTPLIQLYASNLKKKKALVVIFRLKLRFDLRNKLSDLYRREINPEHFNEFVKELFESKKGVIDNIRPDIVAKGVAKKRGQIYLEARHLMGKKFVESLKGVLAHGEIIADLSKATSEIPIEIIIPVKTGTIPN